MKHKSIYTCPHCGSKSFNPITKAFAGGYHTRGRVCRECGLRCVNGKASMIFSAIVYLIAVVIVFYLYFKIADASVWGYIYTVITIVAAYVLCRLFDAFIGPLDKAIRNDAYKQ